MKKLTILTSVLALAACGGGSGGNGTTTPDTLTPQQRNAIKSNVKITAMNSFVVIGGNNPTVNSNARAASNHSFLQDDGGTRYDLENVTFKTIPTSGVISDVMFHTDENGKIESIEFIDAEEIMAQHPGSSVIVGPIQRKSDDTNVFVEKPGQLNEPQNGDIPIEYKSFAKELKLKYSDFGVLSFDTTALGFSDSNVWEMPFAGGYDIKNVDNEQMQQLAQNGDVIFTGLAKGQVSHQHKTVDDPEGHDVVLEGGLNDKHATLTFAQDGTQTLAADFKNWAKIEAVKAANGTNQFIVRESYVANNSPYYLETSPAGLVDGEMNEHEMVFKTAYYGDNGAPAESVGLMQYQQMTDFNLNINEYEHHINVDLGFGGVRNNQ